MDSDLRVNTSRTSLISSQKNRTRSTIPAEQSLCALRIKLCPETHTLPTAFSRTSHPYGSLG